MRIHIVYVAMNSGIKQLRLYEGVNVLSRRQCASLLTLADGTLDATISRTTGFIL